MMQAGLTPGEISRGCKEIFDRVLGKPKSFCTEEEILLNTLSLKSSDHTEIKRILCFSQEQLGLKNTVCGVCNIY